MACASAEMGFHSAMIRNHDGIGAVGTNALDRNVIGNNTVNITPLTASGDRIIDPMRMPNQIIPKPNSKTSANASTALRTPS